MGLTVTGVTAISAGAEPSGQQVEHPYGADAGHPPGTARSTGCRCAATGASTTPSTWPRSPRSATPTAAAAPTTTRKPPRARPTKRRSGASSGGSATPSTPASKPTPARPRKPRPRAREGNRGTTLTPARPAHTPDTGSSDKPLPSPAPPYAPPPRPREPRHPNPQPAKPAAALDNNSKEGSLCTLRASDRLRGAPYRSGYSVLICHAVGGPSTPPGSVLSDLARNFVDVPARPVAGIRRWDPSHDPAELGDDPDAETFGV